ncbi:hypothetical protein Taro_053521, partial [Colocasia esculenta]|nr:hypothetical protein [Colocasia esculenta]
MHGMVNRCSVTPSVVTSSVGSPRFRVVSFIFLRTSVNEIPCEASARSREAESCQVRYHVNGCIRGQHA